MMKPRQFAADQRQACRRMVHIIKGATPPVHPRRRLVAVTLYDTTPHSVSMVAVVS